MHAGTTQPWQRIYLVEMVHRMATAIAGLPLTAAGHISLSYPNVGLLHESPQPCAGMSNLGPGMLPVVEDRGPQYAPQQQHQGYQQLSQVGPHSFAMLHHDTLDACLPLKSAWLCIKAQVCANAQAADMRPTQGGLFAAANQPARPAVDPINIGPGLLQSLQSLTQTHQQPPQQQVHLLLFF